MALKRAVPQKAEWRAEPSHLVVQRVCTFCHGSRPRENTDASPQWAEAHLCLLIALDATTHPLEKEPALHLGWGWGRGKKGRRTAESLTIRTVQSQHLRESTGPHKQVHALHSVSCDGSVKVNRPRSEIMGCLMECRLIADHVHGGHEVHLSCVSWELFVKSWEKQLTGLLMPKGLKKKKKTTSPPTQ